jgi:hypothetical protein
MRRSREETAPQDLPGDLWHALSELQHTHPAALGRVGPLARPVGLLPFAAATDPRLCVAIVDRLTFNGTIIETGTDSYRLASTRARTEEPAKAG